MICVDKRIINLENITKEIKEEIENKANMVVDVEQALEKTKGIGFGIK